MAKIIKVNHYLQQSRWTLVQIYHHHHHHHHHQLMEWREEKGKVACDSSKHIHGNPHTATNRMSNTADKIKSTTPGLRNSVEVQLSNTQ